MKAHTEKHWQLGTQMKVNPLVPRVQKINIRKLFKLNFAQFLKEIVDFDTYYDEP